MVAGTPLVLGREPGGLSVLLARGGSFTARIQSQSAGGTPTDWPEGAALRLVLAHGEQSWTWPFVIAGAVASLTVPAAGVDDLPNRPLRAQLWLDYGDGEFLWCSGEATWHD